VLAEERRQGFVLLSQARRYLLELLQRGQQFRELGRCGEQLRVQVAGLVELDIEAWGSPCWKRSRPSPLSGIRRFILRLRGCPGLELLGPSAISMPPA